MFVLRVNRDCTRLYTVKYKTGNVNKKHATMLLAALMIFSQNLLLSQSEEKLSVLLTLRGVVANLRVFYQYTE